ncbi:MAG: aminotransferase class V-fold PLP-dependent enzyme [Chloroflexota bacterium]
MIYLDNAATTFPKPREVLERMVEVYGRLGVSPGRGSYDLAVEAEQLVAETRCKLANFFGAPDPDRVIFASNATDALNLAIQGIVKQGDHVVSTCLEHNSVLRPLYHLREQGRITYDLVPFDSRGFVDPQDVARAIRPNTSLVIVTHASNVLGTIQPVQDIASLCAERGVPLLIDTAQSAGQVPIDMEGWGVSAIAFTGHKSLLGPTGIGGLICSPDLKIESTRFGGTGVDSKNLVHTPTFPNRLEAGTLNMLGIIGLAAGLDYLQKEGIVEMRQREMALIRRLIDGLASLPRITLYGSDPGDNHVPLLSCNIQGLSPTDVGSILDGDYGIAVRTGLHCAPLVHTGLSTISTGAVRFSLGYSTTEEEVNLAIEAMAEISGGH